MKSPKHYFYLNKYHFYKWTRCIQCNEQTKVRKFCLMIHYQEKERDFNQLFSLNKSCKFCPKCDLIIGQKPDLDVLLQQINPILVQNFQPENYYVFGTLDRKIWAKSQKEPLMPQEALELVSPFKDVLDFEIQPAGWYKD